MKKLSKKRLLKSREFAEQIFFALQRLALTFEEGDPIHDHLINAAHETENAIDYLKDAIRGGPIQEDDSAV